MSFIKNLLLGLAFTPAVLAGQVTDDFSDGDLTSNPAWQGDVSHFVVNANQQLQLNAPAAGTSVLYVPTTIEDSARWEVYFKMDFAPSASNSLYLILQSDTPALLNGNGYYLFVGETGSADAIRFYRMDAGNPVLLASATTGAVADLPEVRLRMEKRPGGIWSLWADYDGGQNAQMEFSVTDPTYPGGSNLFFGLQCQYTATRTDKFFFDDMLVEPLLPDLQAPLLTGATAIGPTEVDVFFDEPLNETTATDPANYFINNGIGQPAAAFLDATDPALVHLSLANNLVSLTDYVLTIQNIADTTGNVANTQTAFFSFVEIQNPAPFDILINEIMADPTPAVALPDVEFVELFNRTNKTLDLEGFGFSSGNTPQLFPSYLMLPNSYLIVCDDEDTDSLTLYGDVIGLDNFPALVNSGDQLTLYDPAGNIIHFVGYSDEWYGNPEKKDGGWTLEMINPLAACKSASNWTASVHLLGGTPGQPNSVLNLSPDVEGPQLLRAFADAAQPSRIQLTFNESLDPATAQNPAHFQFSNGVQVASATPSGPANDVVVLQLTTPLQPSIIYEITLSDSIADCSGNLSRKSTVLLALPEPAQPLDLVINEVLFNPLPGGSDFIEVYNRSDKVLNLGDLVIGNLRQGVDTVVREIKTNKLIFPNGFAVLTENPATLKTHYEVPNEEALLNNDLPALNNDAGNVTLFRGGSSGVVIIDAFDYNENFHHPLLDNPDGVSLERLNPDSPTQDKNNWHSAAATTGFATPSYKNSQNIGPLNPSDAFFEIPEKKLSPDGDGFQDFLQINFHLDAPGYTAQMKIFDLDGHPVKTLLNNELLPTEGFLRWDGDTDRGSKARTGIYIVYAKIFRPDGTVRIFKDTCVVAERL